jgi:hypothetical protein
MRSELGRRVAVSPFEELTHLRREVLDGSIRYPAEHQRSLVSRLNGPDRDFRGALWELFWFNMCTRLGGQKPDVEWRNTAGSLKSVDFYVPHFGVAGLAVEVSCLSEWDDDVLRSFYMSDLMAACQQGVVAPHHFLNIRLVAWTARLPDIGQVVKQIHDWVVEDLWVSDATSAVGGRLRLAFADVGWTFSIEAVPTVAHWDEAWFVWVGEGGLINIGQRIAERLRRKAEKAEAAVGVPFVIAIAETGGFVGSARWHRVNALYGEDVIHLRQDGTSARGRGGNGFFVGPTGWRNPKVSAVAFTGQQLPDFERREVEWWINGGAGVELDTELLAHSGDVLAIRDGQLQILRRRSSEWELAGVE